MADTTDAARVERDPWFSHFLRYCGIAMAVSVSLYAFGAGLFWYAHIFNRSGYRRRDLLLLLIPFYGALVAVQVRQVFRDALIQNGYDEFTANCMVGYLEETYPSGPPDDEPETSIALAMANARNVCQHR